MKGLTVKSELITVLIKQPETFFSLGASSVRTSSVLIGCFCVYLGALTGQLGIEAGPEKTRVTVSLHQTENLILRQLKGGCVNFRVQALIG